LLCTFPLEAHAAHAVQGSCTFYGYHSMVKDHYILSTMCDLLSEWPLMDQLGEFFYRTSEFESTLTLTRIGVPTVPWHIGLSWVRDQIRHVRKSVPGLHSICESDHYWHIVALLYHMGDWSINTFWEENPGTTIYNLRVTYPEECPKIALYTLQYMGEWSNLSNLKCSEECPRIAHSKCTVSDHSWHFQRRFGRVITPGISGGVSQLPGLHSLQNIRESDDSWHNRRSDQGSLSTVDKWMFSLDIQWAHKV
jgi:hypothetical protein